MAKIKIKQVDAFTRTPHTGNPAGVVVDGKELTEQNMQTIAREMNLSETAFVLPTSKPGADVRLRWFTPTTEVPLCGHATIASFHSLAEDGLLGMVKEGKYHFEVETASGILPIDVMKNNGAPSVMFGLKLPNFERTPQYKIDLVRLLNVSISEFENKIPIVRSDDLFVPVRRLHTLFTMKPNFFAMANFLNTRKLRGMCVFTLETVDRESVVHSRFFAPNCGINEDPVTGSAHGPLAVLLYESGLLDIKDGRCVFQGEQGDAIGRRGRVTVELEVVDNKPVSVKIGGYAVTVLEGEMLLHD
ncbi:MAG: PhzF family phenazine biosynthesis protein [Ignavibacteria bacterium]|nr:PhzF family phenazine biosynthesis protein [Ignavibacteria bacterium]MBI3766367.1 PhzF family phenazine biosynthesis protein [Ignavibacteriales bacterium]